MIPALLITGISCMSIGIILGASVQRHVTARKRDERGFHLAPTITHDPCELYASWTDVPAIDIEPRWATE